MRRPIVTVMAVLAVLATAVNLAAANVPFDKDALVSRLYGCDFRQNPNGKLKLGGKYGNATVYAGSMETGGEISCCEGKAPTVKYLITKDADAKQDELPQVSADGIFKLKVPYLNQFWMKEGDLPASLNNSHNCGPASVTMAACYILGKSPNHQMVVALNKAKGSPLISGANSGCDDLCPALKKVFGLQTQIKRMSLDEMIAEVKAGGPVFTDVDYSKLPTRQDKGFSGRHDLLIVGFDEDNVITHDPDDPSLTGKGAYFPYPKKQFRTALGRDDKKCLVGFRRDLKTAKTIPGPKDEYMTEVAIDSDVKWQFHMGATGLGAIWLKEFELTKMDIGRSAMATISIWAKTAAGNRIVVSLNRKVVATINVTTSDWQKYEYICQPTLYIGSNLLDVETLALVLDKKDPSSYLEWISLRLE